MEPSHAFPAGTRAGIVGAGTMGAGIAMAFANAGFEVALVDVDESALARARTSIDTAYDAQVTRGKLGRDEAGVRTRRIVTAPSFNALAHATIVVEAVFEDLAVKRDVFGRIGDVCARDAVLATNTSTLDVDAIAAAAPHPARSLGMHFFSPAHVMKLLEVVRGAHTSPATLARAVAIGHALGKTPVVVGNADGFVGNRMLLGYKREAEWLALAGVAPARVDGVLEAFGFAMGPFAVSDLAGIDVGWRAKQERIKRGAEPPFALTGLTDALVAAGRLGQKTGRGYYRYEPGDRSRRPDPEVDALVAAERARMNVATRDVDDGEIVARCVYALVNEGARILDAGIAASAADIDTIWRDGYGFPRARGGPMQYARDVGLERVLETVSAFARDDAAFWQPASALVRAAARDAWSERG